MKLSILLVVATGAFAWSASGTVHAAQLSAQTHTLAGGDFNGDGKTDLLAIAKDPAQVSGIALSDSGGQPSVLHQSWGSTYLGITWSGNTYMPRIGDFNGDNRDDVFLQRMTGGNHYLLLTDANSKLMSVYQTLTNSQLGIAWSTAERRIEVGDFNNDNYDDLFLQSTNTGVTNAVVFGTSGGFAAVNHSWPNAYLTLEWSELKAFAYAGEFNGDGYGDFFVHAKPNWVLIPFENLTIPVPVYRNESYGLVASDATGKAATVLDTWNRDYLGLEWSPLHYEAFVANFDGACGDDILLQTKRPGTASYIVLTACGGTLPTNATVFTLAHGEFGLGWDTTSYKFQVADFNGDGRADIYMQAQAPAGTSRIAYAAVGGDITTTPLIHDPGGFPSGANVYEYDSLGRVDKVTYPDGSYVDYDYDAAGNRSLVTGVKN
jgi:YD repeat-containing protein